MTTNSVDSNTLAKWSTWSTAIPFISELGRRNKQVEIHVDRRDSEPLPQRVATAARSGT